MATTYAIFNINPADHIVGGVADHAAWYNAAAVQDFEVDLHPDIQERSPVRELHRTGGAHGQIQGGNIGTTTPKGHE